MSIKKNGTGHAAMMAAPVLSKLEGNTFIMPGDVPLIWNLMNVCVEDNDFQC